MKRLLLLLLASGFATNVFAIDRWIAIAGTVNNFSTDTRVLNPSGTKDIEISAYFLPVGNGDNSGRVSGTPVKFTVKKREMKVLDNVVGSLFNTSGIGGILLRSDDDFSATSRIFATVSTGTLGQFAIADRTEQALTSGAVLQLKSNAANRTNVGAINTSASPATVTWKLHNKTNSVVATGTTTMPPFAVIGPTNIAGTFFFNIPAGTDTNDLWLSFTSTQPIFVYGSIVDNGTTDPTYAPAVADSGTDPVDPPPPPPGPTTHSFDVTLVNWEISFNGDPSAVVKVGDTVKLHVHSDNGTHGFEVFAPNATVVVPDRSYSPGTSRDFEFVASQPGTYTYFCTVSTCGEGHTGMFGDFTVRSN